VLARTTIVTRNVVAMPDGYAIEEVENPATVSEIDPEREAAQRFWKEFLTDLKLDDPEQQSPIPHVKASLASCFRRQAAVVGSQCIAT
jgi:hypothetical protein